MIAFNGYKYLSPDDPNSGEITKEDGAANCVKALKQLAGYAEKKKVTICVEHLNSRDDSHPMKGHPGYQGDDLDYVAAIIRKVGSPYVKLLFDIYHVQVMHGDVIRRLEQTRTSSATYTRRAAQAAASWTTPRNSTTLRSCESCSK